jgi:hypothetical protein
MKYISDSGGYPVALADSATITLLCGSIAHFDTQSGISYRCDTCMAVVGSIAMPRECKELYDMEDVVNKLKGKR